MRVQPPEVRDALEVVAVLGSIPRTATGRWTLCAARGRSLAEVAGRILRDLVGSIGDAATIRASQRDKAPTNALMAQAVKSCADRGIKHLLYANFSYGRKQTDGLAEFKRANGFEKVEVPRYFVPLTIKGRIALRFGLHHDAKTWIPESIAARYRRLREAWYDRKLTKLENA